MVTRRFNRLFFSALSGTRSDTITVNNSVNHFCEYSFGNLRIALADIFDVECMQSVAAPRGPALATRRLSLLKDELHKAEFRRKTICACCTKNCTDVTES